MRSQVFQKKKKNIRHSERDPVLIEGCKGLGSGSKGKGINRDLIFGFNTPLALLGSISMTLNYLGPPAVAGPMLSPLL